MFGNAENRIVDSQSVEHLIGSHFDDFSPWIEVFVYTVPKAHQAERVIFVFCFINKLIDIASVFMNFFKHFNHRLVCPAVETTPKG